jgi:hypothetical protein
MGSGVRYRYRGKFISQRQAQRLGNLKHTKTRVRTEYLHERRATASRRGYLAPMERRLKRALEKDRAERVRRVTPKTEQRRFRRESEQARARGLARRAFDMAEAEDMSYDDALDFIGYTPDTFDTVDYDDVIEMVEAVADDVNMDFEMMDLEQEVKRKS